MGFLDYKGLERFLKNSREEFAQKSHTHDERYYTEYEIDNKLSKKSDVNHIHDDRYYTEAEVDGKLEGKSSTDHTHDLSELISALSIGTSTTLNDAVQIITQDTDTANQKYYRRPLTVLWNYIKSKADSVYSAIGHNHKIQNLEDYTTRVYDATIVRPADTVLASPQDKDGIATFRKLDKNDVGLENVDNTADKNKNVATAGIATTGVRDYNNANNIIKIGWSGTELDADSLTYVAGYTSDKKIHPASKDGVRSWLGLGDSAYKNTKSRSSKGSTDWTNNATDDAIVPTMSFMAYWDGAYNSNGASNLSYCDRGRFGTIVTKNTGDYAVAGHTHLNGTKSGAVDWNTFITYGVYKIQNCTMDNARHAPPDEYAFGILQVLDSENNGGEKRIIQIYWPHSTAKGNHLWYRMHNSSDINAGWSGWVPIKNKPDASGISDVTNALSGFTPRSGQGWGVQTGTFVHGECDSTGGAFAFRRDCPNAGQVSMVLDGRFYQNDGQYMCLDTNNYSSYALPLTGGTISGALNFANGTWNLVGDDAYMGDHNIGGSFCIMGANDTTRLALVNKDNQGDYALVEYGGGNLNFNKKLGANITGHADGDLALSGGTMSGRIIRNAGGAWINDRDNVAVWNGNSNSNSYNPVVGQKTKNGAWTIGCLGDWEELLFNYSTDANYGVTNDTKRVHVPIPSGSDTVILTAETYPLYALPKSGGEMTGDITFSNVGTGLRQIKFTCADNDFARIAASGTASNAGYMEIATADDGNEPIYVRQYSGVYANIVRSASLLDGNGNTSFPGAVTANTYYAPNWFRATGNSGFYFENHGGGWYMIDDTWIRAYNNKNIYTPGVIQCDSGFNGNLNGNATTSTLVRHQGNVTAISGTATRTAGLQLYGAYTNGYPMSYGNVICASNGAFGSEIALDCVGGGGKQGPGRMYYRNRSDWDTSEWSDWATVAYLTDKVAGAGTADKAEYLGNDAAYMRMHWNGQGGQPTWLWGGNDASNMYVWNPSNFSVNYANSAGNGVVASGSNYVRFGDGTQICWGQQGIANAGTTITFAVAFSSIPAVVNSGTEDIDDVFFVRNITTTNFVADKIGWFSGNNTWIAIGRWK